MRSGQGGLKHSVLVSLNLNNASRPAAAGRIGRGKKLEPIDVLHSCMTARSDTRARHGREGVFSVLPLENKWLQPRSINV